MRVVLARNDLAKLPRLIADMDVRRTARAAAGRAATQGTARSQGRQTRAREAISDARARAISGARARAMSRGRGLRSLRVTTEPPRSQGDRRLLVGVLLGFLAGLTAMYFLQRRAAARRQARLDARLSEAAPEDAGEQLVGVMGREQEHDGSGPAQTPAEAVAERVEVSA